LEKEMPKLEAIVDCPFGVGVQPQGSQFDATDDEAKILIALQRAKLAEEKAKAKAPEPDPKPEKTSKTAGEYNRRDMKAKG
jgi:hypothetical protein